MSRLPARLLTLGLAAASTVRRRQPPADASVRRVLVAHYLLLGDTVLLAPLLAKLARQFPAAERIVLARPAVAALFTGRPWGFRALAYDPKDFSTFQALRAAGPFDHAYVVGDNRYAWLARAVGARWVTGLGDDAPGWKNWMLDAASPAPEHPKALAEMFAELAPGPAPTAFLPGDWPQPPAQDFALPTAPYVVFHVGASTTLKGWLPERWRKLADFAVAGGYQPVWSGGRGEEALVAAVDPEGRYPSYCGKLDLPGLWRLLAGARLLASPDTGVAHLGKLVGVPTMTLFGPGSAELCGAGDFWHDAPYLPVAAPDFPCRNQTRLFRRDIGWVRRCGRSAGACAEASAGLPAEPGFSACMSALAVDDAIAAFQRLTG